jgi:hypothetical protein
MIVAIEQLALPLAAAALVIALIAVIWLLILQRRLNKISGKSQAAPAATDTAEISKVLSTQAVALERTAAQVDILTGQVNQLLEIIPHAFQRVGLVRFNPFGDTGSDQSFSIALLDGRGEGLVLSGLYSRGGMRVYAKPVAGGRSEYALSDEEQQAISQAMAD